MGTVNNPLASEARSIFAELGYTVSESGSEFTAERGWKAVEVTPMPEPTSPPTSGSLRCFVTYQHSVRDVRRRIRRANPEYDWAIITVEDDDYEVVRAPPAAEAA
ncbi:hypothetical protein ACFQH2_10430 [Natronoarchaeum sp. GCM10025703]|jgi:hypothetical protein|uniref:DUF7116 family protein n=1 Tax=unclassified Natronoarchaeum TaxID=2620183 RepID=UPI003609F277